MKKFDVNILGLPKGLGEHSISTVLLGNTLHKDMVICDSPPSFDFAKSDGSKFNALIREWSQSVFDQRPDKNYAHIFAQRGSLCKALPEDFYVSQLPDKATLPRGKCRTKVKFNIYPQSMGDFMLDEDKTKTDIDVEFTVTRDI